MDDLDGEKNQQTDVGSIVDGEKNVGDKSGEEGELEEVAAGKLLNGIDKAEKNSAEFDTSEDDAVRRGETDNNDGEKNPDPKEWPRLTRSVGSGFLIHIGKYNIFGELVR